MARHKDVPVETIPEVVALEQTKARMKAFREANPEFFKYLDGLVEEYNDRVQLADKVVRARGVSCGDFELYQYRTTYDPEYLYSRFGREAFLELGGKIEVVQKRSVDKKQVELNIKAGRIPPADAEQVCSTSPSYHAPKPLNPFTF